MILLYGAGGEPGRGEIPMDPIRYRASDDFLLHVGCRGQITCTDQSPKPRDLFWVLMDRNDSNIQRKEVKPMKKQWILRKEMMQYGKDPINRCRHPVL